MTNLQEKPLTLAEVRENPPLHLAPEDAERLADEMLAHGRGRPRKDGPEYSWLSDRQMAERRKDEVPLGAGIEWLSPQLRPNVGDRCHE